MLLGGGGESKRARAGERERKGEEGRQRERVCVGEGRRGVREGERIRASVSVSE